MRRRLGGGTVLAVVAAVLAFAAGAGAAGAAGTAGADGTAKRAAGAVAPLAAVRFIARTTTPKADTPWSYCVIAVDAKTIKPVEAAVTQRLFDPQGHPIGNVGSASFLGAWCQAIKLPASIRGQAITLETKVVARGREQRIRTPIRVR